MDRIEKNQIFLIKQIKDFDTHQCYQIWHPSTDLFETKEKYIVKLEIGVMESKDFSINFYKDVLSIMGIEPGKKKRAHII